MIIKCYPSSQQLFCGKWPFCNPQCNHSTAVLRDYTGNDWCYGLELSAEEWSVLTEQKVSINHRKIPVISCCGCSGACTVALWSMLQGTSDLSSETTSNHGARSPFCTLSRMAKATSPPALGYLPGQSCQSQKGEKKKKRREESLDNCVCSADRKFQTLKRCQSSSPHRHWRF